MEIRGEEILLPVSAVSAFPRPHWLQGRAFGSRSEPTYRSHNLRVAYEDAVKLCAAEQQAAGLHVLTDGVQYYEWEAPGFQLEPIFRPTTRPTSPDHPASLTSWWWVNAPYARTSPATPKSVSGEAGRPGVSRSDA